MRRIIRAAVEKTAYSFDKPYDYTVPDRLYDAVKPGCRVLVPFGNGNRKRQAMVLEVCDVPEVQGIKAVHTLLDEEPVLSAELLSLVTHLRETTFCTYYDAVKAILPVGLSVDVDYSYEAAALPEGASDIERTVYEYIAGKKKKPSGSGIIKALQVDEVLLDAMTRSGMLTRAPLLRRRILDGKIAMVRLTQAYRPEEEPDARFSAKQQAVLRFLSESGGASLKELCYYCGVTRVVPDNLARAGLLEIYEKEAYRNPYAGREPEMDTRPVTLTAEQETALSGLRALYDAGKPEVSLLYGVTGSGKTQVFHSLIAHVLATGRSVIVMVPEISLTPQTIDGFQRRFGQRVAVLHSALTLAERLDEWKRIKAGEADIVVGTRSAVFAPLPNIGLIVMDEEQEGSYHSQRPPRYHAREVAKFRCARHGAQLLLCSATPSVESYYHAKMKRYHLFTLKQRYSAFGLPDVYVIDMRDELAATGGAFLSRLLCEELAINLQRGEQSILLMNRRGYHSVSRCISCSETVSCPSCSVPLTYHSANQRLMCHYCGHSQSAVKDCPKCGAQYMSFAGAGTQKIEEQLSSLFPDARILRMDMDTTMSRFAYEQHFTDFAAGGYDIMIGTQMVAKGLDFPNVTLVGVLSADQALYAQDFRSFERANALLTQVVGRCGRAGLPGRAYIQTFTPENPVIELASTQNYDAFFREEIALRKLNLYPPLCAVCTIGITGISEPRVKEAANRFAKMLSELAGREYASLPLRLLGPAQAGILRMAGQYRYKIVLKCRNDPSFREMLSRLLQAFGTDKANRGIRIYADMYADGEI